MKKIKGIYATSNVDNHGKAFSVEALKMLVEQINNSYMPMGVEHDPRIPPIGRIISAKLIKRDDGSYAVEGISEIFEEGDCKNRDTSYFYWDQHKNLTILNWRFKNESYVTRGF